MFYLKMLRFISILIWSEYFHMTKIIRSRNVKTGPAFELLVQDPGSWILGPESWVPGLNFESQVMEPGF